MGGHSKGDGRPDRIHFSKWETSFARSLESAHRWEHGGEWFTSKHTAGVHVEQHDEHRSPHVKLAMMSAPGGHGREYPLTVDEALRLAKALMTAVDIAENPGGAS